MPQCTYFTSAFFKQVWFGTCHFPSPCLQHVRAPIIAEDLCAPVLDNLSSLSINSPQVVCYELHMSWVETCGKYMLIELCIPMLCTKAYASDLSPSSLHVLQVLNPLQFVRAAVQAYPLYPDAPALAAWIASEVPPRPASLPSASFFEEFLPPSSGSLAFCPLESLGLGGLDFHGLSASGVEHGSVGLPGIDMAFDSHGSLFGHSFP